MTSDVTLLKEVNNCQIVQVAGRKHPGIVLQGDTLSTLVDLASDVVRLLNESDIDEARATAQEIHDLLAGRLKVFSEVINRLSET